jgi:hypothetical protein
LRLQPEDDIVNRIAARGLTTFAALTALSTLLGLVGSRPAYAQAPAQQAAATPERTVWYFYKVKWGFQDEYMALFRRNHLSVLKEEIKTGRMKSVRTFVPEYHGDGRADWTFAVEIVYRDVGAMTGPSDDDAIQKRLFPDRAKFLEEEQRRFELLEAHWDVPLNTLSVDK